MLKERGGVMVLIPFPPASPFLFPFLNMGRFLSGGSM